MDNVMFVASSRDMASFVSGFLKSAMQNNRISFYLVIILESDEIFSSETLRKIYSIEDLSEDRLFLLRFPKSKILRHLNCANLVSEILFIASSVQSKHIHFLTQNTFIASNLYRFDKFQIYYTVHDLVPHSSRASLVTRFNRYFLHTLKDRWLIKKINNLVTSSKQQYDSLKELYPNKKIFYHDMPSLVTSEIIDGKLEIPEINGLKDYILFFGRIEHYKGVEFLYNAFICNPEFRSQKLVIAGKGEIYFKRDLENESNVFFVNRFIRDSEIKSLFSNAKFIIYPYLSTTQTAVFSLAYFFSKPIITSNIKGMKDFVIHEKSGLILDSLDSKSITQSINRMLNDEELLPIYENAKAYFYHFYDMKEISNQIGIIYN